MPLTPEDVRKKTFTPVRLREGYDMGEVDQFLDDVEVELTRLLKESADLRTQVPTAEAAPGSGSDSISTGKPTPGGVPPEEVALPPVKTVPEASSAAARLLEIATTNADQLVTEAQSEADGILGSAKTQAERLEGEAKSRAEALETRTHARSQQLESEIAAKRQQLFEELERDKESLTRELEDLRAFEREYRSRLKSYFQSQLRALDGEVQADPQPTPSADGDTPRRLRELLGEEEV